MATTAFASERASALASAFASALAFAVARRVCGGLALELVELLLQHLQLLFEQRDLLLAAAC
ncbi:hypothetical protein ABIF94_006382 [Bradyrhizobium ottawaense]